MNTIIHPFTKKAYNLYSKKGKQLLKKYILNYNFLKQSGGRRKNSEIPEKFGEKIK